MALIGDKYKYDRVKARGTDGKARYSANNKDAVSRALFGMDRAAIERVAEVNGLADKLAVHKTKNAGHFRMIVGQALRGMIAAKHPVTIGGTVVESLDQDVAWAGSYVEESITKRKV